LSSTTFDERYGSSASGTIVSRKFCSPLSKLWLPMPSAEKPMWFMSSIVGVSPKNAEIGGVAPIESWWVSAIATAGSGGR
jgi:hypothetical protein